MIGPLKAVWAPLGPPSLTGPPALRGLKGPSYATAWYILMQLELYKCYALGCLIRHKFTVLCII